MLYKAHNGNIAIDNTFAHYISFGKGKKNLIIIPGLGEAFKSVKGLAIPMAILYHKYAKDYKIYVFSRRQDIPKHFTTCDMANDIICHMPD